jgi:carbon monoxide dehydrogenase subunit G
MILTYILIAVAVVVVGLVIVVAMQPADFRYERSATMSAPSSAVFDQVNDFRRWTAWSPGEKLDPQLKRTYEGAATGAGAIYSWSGNKHVGEGRMTITDSRPSDLIRIKLEFLRPFKATNASEFAFQPEGNQTRVTWSMTGRNGFISKAFCLLVNMDKMIGRDFEKGLANMKAVVEGSVAAPSQINV